MPFPPTQQIPIMRHLLVRIIALCTLIVLASSTLVSCSGRVYEVIGAAMEPSFSAGQSITAIPVDPATLQRGDAVVYRLDNGDVHLNRIVGLPGDTVRVEHGRVFVNNESLDGPYLAADIAPMDELAAGPAYSKVVSTTLSADEYFTLGDNLGASYDSRFHGPVSSDSIVGRVKVTFLNRLTTW